MESALTSQGIYSWEIVKRQNPAANFPSDFDIIRLKGSSCELGVAALRSHFAVKRVSPQRQVFRKLKFVNETEAPVDAKGEFELPRFTGRSSLSLVLSLVILDA